MKIKKNNLLNKKNTGLLVLLFVFFSCSVLISNISATEPFGTIHFNNGTHYNTNDSFLIDDVNVTNYYNDTMSLKAYQIYPDNNNFVWVDIDYTNHDGGDQSVFIQKVLNESGESRLKITTVYITANPKDDGNVEYVNTSLSPRKYYLKIYKPNKIDKFLGLR